MKTTLTILALSASIGAANAATCNFVFGGKTLWHGACFVTAESDGGLHADAHANLCHSRGGTKKCTIEEACAGPWLNISKEDDGTFSSYWSMEGACHGRTGDAADHLTQDFKDGETYRGKNYSFSYKY